MYIPTSMSLDRYRNDGHLVFEQAVISMSLAAMLKTGHLSTNEMLSSLRYYTK